MSYVADDMLLSGYPKPTFVVQADYTEIFGDIDNVVLDYTKNALRIHGEVDLDDSVQHAITASDNTPESSLLSLVRSKSENEYCTQDEAESNIQLIGKKLKKENWPSEIIDFFDLEEIEYNVTHIIPNAIEIGRWINANSAESLFAMPRFSAKKYTTEEYKKIPKRPKSTSMSNYLANSLLSGFKPFGMDEEYEYRLEKVEKSHEVIDGFEYSTAPSFRPIKILFKPLHASIEHYSLTLVVLFSKKMVVVFTAKEVLPYKSWEGIYSAKCSDWTVKSLMLKNVNQIEQYVSELIDSVSSYICNDISIKLAK
jgi:hypothetical protein